MYALAGILVLIVFTYIRPQEFVPWMASIPWLNILVGLTACGFVLDWFTGRIRKERAPTLRWALFFYFWCLFTLWRKSPADLGSEITALTTGIFLSLIMQHSIQSMKTFSRVAAVVYAITMFCTMVAFHQGFQDFQCLVVRPDPDAPASPPLIVPDGRGCQTRIDCHEQGGADPEAAYTCEKVGMFGTTSVAGRVRWRGVLNDPNEITLAACTAAPYALAFFESKRSIWRLLLVLATVIVVPVTCILSQSRGAVLVFLAVVSVYFVSKKGVRGLVFGGALGAPLLMLGGRGGDEAAQSAQERIEVMADGLGMFFQNPLMGVGYRQYTKHSFLTAHNSYLLASAELGIVGFLAWSVIVWTIMKAIFVAYRRYDAVPGGQLIRAWSLALLASLSGTLVGIFFLSWTYHYVLWIYFGVAGGFYSTIRSTDRGFDVTPTRREVMYVLVADTLFMIALRLYVRLKGY